MIKHTYDVAIVGAGIAGCALAKLLADLGWYTVLFERKTFPRHKVCGEFLSPEGSRMLNTLGVSERVRQLRPSQIDHVNLIFHDQKPLHIPLPGPALGLSRHTLDSELLNAAIDSGVEVMMATTVTSIYKSSNKSGNNYILQTNRRGEMTSFQAHAVIAACGIHGLKRGDSTKIRTSSKNKKKANKKSYVGIKSHFVGIGQQSTVDLYFFDGGYLGISPVENGRFNVAALLERNAFPHKPKTIMAWLEAIICRSEKLQHQLANATPVQGTQAAIAPIELDRKPVVWNEFPNVGDAISMIPPLCGDGMSMALRSALLCAPHADQFLKGEITEAIWEAEYTRAIYSHFQSPGRWGRFIQWSASVPIIPQILLQTVRFSPRMAHKLVQATRLKE